MSFDTIATPAGRVKFNSVFEPKSFMNNSPKYEITLLIPKEGNETKKFLAELNRELKVEYTAFWTDAKGKAKPDIKELTMPIKDGDKSTLADGTLKKDKYPEYAGCWEIKATCLADKNKPKVVRQQDIDGKVVNTPVDKGSFKDGYWARMTFHTFGYDYGVKSRGISAILHNVLLVKEDKPLGGSGGTSVEDDFGGVFDEPDDFTPSSNDTGTEEVTEEAGLDFLG